MLGLGPDDIILFHKLVARSDGHQISLYKISFRRARLKNPCVTTHLKNRVVKIQLVTKAMRCLGA
jgi:hypothetical protein